MPAFCFQEPFNSAHLISGEAGPASNRVMQFGRYRQLAPLSASKEIMELRG